MIVRSYGCQALLVDVDDRDQVAALRTRLADPAVPGIVESMPGLRTVLVRFEPDVVDARDLARTIVELDLSAQPEQQPQAHLALRVDYGGPDLAAVAELTGLTADEVVAAHQAATYQVVLIGMAPGFYFLGGGDPRLHVPRRPTPRTNVVKGALGMAGDYTGIYPRTGPGGWQLIGRVIDDLWHPTRVPAALLVPGVTVTFAAA